MEPSRGAPRVARVELGGLEPVLVPGASLPGHGARRRRPVELTRWGAADPAHERLGLLSGAALGVAWLLERERMARGDPSSGRSSARSPDPLLLSVGAAVVRGLPTAARATVAARAPASGRYSDGQVGSELGRRLAAWTDLLVLEGTARGDGALVLWIEAGKDGVTAELLSLADLSGASPAAVGRRLRALGAQALLSIGPAGERRLPFASLASGDEPPSLVGRGGLGAVLGALCLKAVAFVGAPVTPAPDDASAARGLVSLLERSPRLAARAAGGSLELFELAGEGAGALEAARATALGRKGCRGCPTPCGWVLDAPRGGDADALTAASGVGARGAHDAGAPRGAHHTALVALGAPLGLSAEDALELCAACDAAGVDAREAGRLLELVARACEAGAIEGPSPRGDRAALAGWIDDVANGRPRAAVLARGVASAARALGLDESPDGSPGTRAGRAADDLARLLAASVGARGAEPLRGLALPGGPGAGAGRLARLLAPVPACAGLDDPRDPRGKGRVVWWHESLLAALDVLGFCAFSAAGLLGDGLADVDELARALVPAGWSALGAEPSARALFAAGAALVLAERELAFRQGRAPEDERLPPGARAAIERPGMRDEYRALCGLDERGRPTRAAWALLGRAELLDLALSELAARRSAASGDAGGPVAPAVERGIEPAADAAGSPGRSPVRSPVRSKGVVRVRGLGPLASYVGERAVELPLPATVHELVSELARRVPEAAPRLLARGLPVPAVLRDGHALADEDLVRDGERVDLVLAIAGGSA